MSDPGYDIVVPTIGRPSLGALLRALATTVGPLPQRLIVVDDRPPNGTSLFSQQPPAVLAGRMIVTRSHGRGPAAARNSGWRLSAAPWVAFLDDDVVPTRAWAEQLAADLRDLGDDAGGSQGRIQVPLPADRRATDRERSVAGLAAARWATADMAYRRAVLDATGGFDERFTRAYREDADLAIRVRAAGYRLVRGSRRVLHPVAPAGVWASVRAQAGNADDALMRRIHGRRWRALAEAPRGRRARHATIAAAGLLALAGMALRRKGLARVAAGAWLAGTGELAVARIAPGPATPAEVARMLITSPLIPPAAVWHYARGWLRHRRPRTPRAPVVLFDRDGTLIADVPGNGDPSRVVAMPSARSAIDRLRAAGARTAVVSNQGSIGRGLLSASEVAAVNRRIEQLLGPLGPWLLCPHAPERGCSCRKPSPRLLLEACRALGAEPRDCVMVGDIGADVEAARAAGMRAVMVPTPRTRPEEVAAAPAVARDLLEATNMILEGPR